MSHYIVLVKQVPDVSLNLRHTEKLCNQSLREVIIQARRNGLFSFVVVERHSNLSNGGSDGQVYRIFSSD